MSSADFTYDLRWFLDPAQLFKPDIVGSDFERDLIVMRRKLPCLIWNIDHLDRTVLEILAKQIREKMQTLGFYSKGLKNRPSNEFLEKEVAGAKSQSVTVPQNAPKIAIFVYTDPTPAKSNRKATPQDCLRSTEKGSPDICVLCVGRFEAHKRAKAFSGKAVEIPATGGPEDFWTMIDEVARGKQIVQLQVFGHGLFGGILLGNKLLKAEFQVPIAFQGCRFASNAEIRFFGCNVAKQHPVFWEPLDLMRDFGALLCRGGRVCGFKTVVGSTCSRADGLKLLEQKENEICLQFDPCDARKTALEFVNLLTKFVNAGEKVVGGP